MKSFYLLLIVLLWSCTAKEEEKLTDSERNYGVTASAELGTDNSAEDFESFFSKFSKDSTFQKSNILFPLQVKSDDGENEETRLMEKEEWEYTDYLNLPYVHLERKRIKADLVNLIFTKDETGILVYHYFQKVNGHWILISIEDHST